MIKSPNQGGIVKKSLPFIPIVLLVFLHACSGATLAIPIEIGTAVANTQTATMWTPTLSPTPNYYIPAMIGWLNLDLSATLDPLEQTLDAKYLVTDISFPPILNSQSLTFRVDVQCECAANANCCVPERMFVVLVNSLRRNQSAILQHVPLGLSEMIVVCRDHQRPIGAMYAFWPDIQGYLLGYVNGYQLGPRVIRTVVP
jgi:hypothetical protein